MAKDWTRALLSLLLWTHYLSQAQSVPSVTLKVGDKCSPTLGANSTGLIGGVCDAEMPLECSVLSGRCVCKGGFTLSRNGSKCLEIVGGAGALDSPCEESIQCWKGALGRLSECNQKTNTCSCYTSDNLPIIFHQGRCYYGESLGDFCQVEGLCEATTEKGKCRGGRCGCGEGYVGSWDKSRCLPIGRQGLQSPCDENVQCEASSLGALSECSEGRCQCYRIPILPTIFHNERCYFGAALGDVCQVDQQCQALSPGSVCSKEEGKCICGEGSVGNGNGSLCLQIPSSDSSSLPEPNCSEDIQCQRALGSQGRCSPLHKKCECVGRENETELLTIIGGKCHPSKPLGAGCKFGRQCSSRTENSVCYKGVCECDSEGWVPSSDFRKCLKIVESVESGCDESEQCRRGPLGPLSTCNAATNKCDCRSSLLPLRLFKGRCYFHRSVGAPCQGHTDCQASIEGPSACYNHTCQCNYATTHPNHCSNHSQSTVLENKHASILFILFGTITIYIHFN